MCMETVNINGQSYEVHEEVAEQFSKFIRRAKVSKAKIKELEKLMMSDKYKLKEQSENPCDQCGSYKFTQTISEKVGVICKECLVKTLDRALEDVLSKL